MRMWACRQLLQIAVGVFAAVFIMMPPAMAQNNTGPTVEQFLANPAQVLQQFPNGGPRLISLIRDAALKDPSALSSIIALLTSADPDQQMAIGSGLGQAAQLSVKTNQAYANQIQQDLTASGNQNALLAFAGVTGNVQIASGGGGGGGGGGFGGSTGGGSFSGGFNGGSTPLGSWTNPNGSTNYFTGHSFGGATNSVSPH
jgi:hypothetical protein